MYETCVEFIQSETGQRATWSFASCAVAFLAVLLFTWLCKACWHTGAFARRMMTPAPAPPLATEVQLLVDAIREGGMRRVTVNERGTNVASIDVAGASITYNGTVLVNSKDVTRFYTDAERLAIIAAYEARNAALLAEERDKARHEAIGMPCPEEGKSRRTATVVIQRINLDDKKAS